MDESNDAVGYREFARHRRMRAMALTACRDMLVAEDAIRNDCCVSAAATTHPAEPNPLHTTTRRGTGARGCRHMCLIMMAFPTMMHALEQACKTSSGFEICIFVSHHRAAFFFWHAQE